MLEIVYSMTKTLTHFFYNINNKKKHSTSPSTSQGHQCLSLKLSGLKSIDFIHPPHPTLHPSHTYIHLKFIKLKCDSNETACVLDGLKCPESKVSLEHHLHPFGCLLSLSIFV